MGMLTYVKDYAGRLGMMSDTPSILLSRSSTMSNRLKSAGTLPLIIDPLQARKLGQAINNNQRQVAQTVALGDAYMAPFRAIAAMFSWIGRSIEDAVELRNLYETCDRQLADIGIQRRQIAIRRALRRHEQAFQRNAVRDH